MNRAILTFFLFSVGLALFFDSMAQNEPKKIILSAEWQYHDEDLMPGVDRFIGHVVFKHENTIGYCDSAYNYANDDYMLAFGNPVKIYINDSVKLYGDYLIYNSRTKIVSIYRNVIMKDNTSALYTDSLIYNNNTSVGYYVTGGKMINKDNVLTSIIGEYYTKTNEVILKKNVKLVNETYTMNCQSLRYNTQTENVYFTSRTHLQSKENNIYTNAGWYNIPKNISLLIDSVELINKTQHVSADSIFYDKNKSFGIAWNNVVICDTQKAYVIKGNYAEHCEKGGTSIVTDSTLLILIDNKDSLYLHSDTIKITFDSLQEPQIMKAYYHSKFFHKDLQGACDSITYIVQDSIISMYYNPIIWSGENQLSGDTIHFTIIDSINSTLELCKNGFIVAPVFEELEFNQIKGVNIKGYLQDNKLKKVDITNNAESVYYLMDEDTALIGINMSATSEMTILFSNNEISDIIFYNNPDGKIYPDSELTFEKRFLKDFRWLTLYRAKRREDIFINPIPRKK